jgi:hypothetical protein
MKRCRGGCQIALSTPPALSGVGLCRTAPAVLAAAIACVAICRSSDGSACAAIRLLLVEKPWPQTAVKPVYKGYHIEHRHLEAAVDVMRVGRQVCTLAYERAD